MTRYLLLAGAVAMTAASTAVAKSRSTTHSTTTTIIHPNGYETHSRSVTKSSSTKTSVKVHAPTAQGTVFGPAWGSAPMGHSEHRFRKGERVPAKYKYYTSYRNLPAPLVTRYGLTDQDDYIYRKKMIYVVDPDTHRVTRVIKAG